MMRTNPSHRGTHLLLAAMALFASAIVPSRGEAQSHAHDEEARALYEAGRVAFDDGRFEAALDRWTESYALVELPALLYNIGTAHDRLGHVAEALDFYERFLEANPDAPNRNYVERRVEVLSAQAAALERANPTDSDEHGDPGEGALGAGATTDDAVSEAGSDEASADDEAEAPRGQPAGAIVVASLGVAVLGAAIATGVVSNGRYADLEERCPGGVCPADAQDDIDALQGINLATDVLFAAGGALLVGGVIGWIVKATQGDDDEEDRAAVQLDVGPGSLVLRGTF